MKTLITTLNSKYIHKSLSLRLLYVACKPYHDVAFKEYTIKDNLDHIVADILEMDVQVVAFSVYIWNVKQTEYICQQLKSRKESIKILIGGPEVSYEIDHFLDTFAIDYIISGEGEIACKEVLDALANCMPVEVQGVSSKDKRDYRQSKNVDLTYIESLESPYLLEQDKQDMAKRVLYFETSRGCPYRCQYCLSSLEKGLRFFSQEYLAKQLEDIIHSDVKIVKVLDRSFNAKTEHALFILDFICSHYRPNLQFQFEINGDVLDQKIIDFIVEKAPPGLLRFEIGIQSTYEPTNKIVQRYQDFDRLASVIKQLQDSHKVDLHLDLIAGLPLENLERFAKSFDDVFAFHPKELQLGFLKLLRGTSLREKYLTYGYTFDEHPPYEISQSNSLSKQDIETIHIAEDMLEKYWNSGKMPLTMMRVIQQVKSPFYFFLELGKFYQKNQYKTMHYQNDELFQYLDTYLKQIGLELTDVLIEDYLRLAKVKPKRWWTATLTTEQRKQLTHQLIEKHGLVQERVFRYGMLECCNKYDLLAVYQDYQVQIYKFPHEDE